MNANATAPTGRKIIAQGKERSDAALGHDSQNTSSPEGAKELPNGWKRSQLGEIGRWFGGGTPSKANARFWTNGNIPWVSPKDMKTERIADAQDHITADAVAKSATSLVDKGSVLVVVRSGILKHTLPVAITEREVALNQDLKAVTPSEGVRSDYLALALKAFERDILHTCCKSGTTVQNLEMPVFLRFPIPVAPEREQRRIVAEIEKQFTRLEAGVAALRRVQANLKRYRAAVLKAACEGQLVPTEAKWKNLPFKDLIGKIGQGWSPKCDLTRDALPDEWAIVTTTAVQSMKYVDNQGKPLPLNLEPRPHIEIKAGDFLMTRKGPRKRAGVACLVRSTRPKLMVCDTVYRFRCHESLVVPSYLEIALNSPDVVHAIDRQKAGINESGVSLTHDKLGAVLIPLPPLAEQTRIVAEVERRLSVVEELESVVSANLQRATRLRQSILQKAFTGELLSTEQA